MLVCVGARVLLPPPVGHWLAGAWRHRRGRSLAAAAGEDDALLPARPAPVSSFPLFIDDCFFVSGLSGDDAIDGLPVFPTPYSLVSTRILLQALL